MERAKYEECEIEVTYSGKVLEELPEYADITKVVAESEAIVWEILQQFSEVDQSINEMRERFSATSNSLFDAAGDLFNSAGKTKNGNEAALGAGIGLALAAAGLVTEGVGLVTSLVKKRQAKKQKQIAMEAALEKKKEMAEEKFDSIKKFRNSFSSVVGKRVEASYMAEFEKTITSSDPQFDLKMKIFRRNLGLQLKTDFLKDKLDFVLAEMTAWKSGRHDSDYKPKDMLTILEDELKRWPKRLVGITSWDGYLKAALLNKNPEVPMPTALLLTDKTLLSNYVGINIDLVENCPSALLEATNGTLDVSMLPTAAFLEKNPYLVTCRKALEDEYNPPAYPKKFGTADIIALAIPILIAFITVLYGFIAYPGIMARILFILLGVLIAAGACLLFSDGAGNFLFSEFDVNLHLRLPYERAYENYSDKYELMRERIRHAELNARVDDSGIFEIK